MQWCQMKLYIIGFGAGNYQYMTMQAKEALEDSEVIVGYSVYVELVQKYIENKEYYSTSMKKEEERCRWAIEKTLQGKKVAIICSGDSGVYGLASLVYELAVEYEPFEIEVISGVTAALSGGAVLGAPLTHDFAVISLSDLLTPWDLIEKRLQCSAMCDMVICLYNPSSKKRFDYLKKACEIILKYRKKETVCGYVRNIGREGESSQIMNLVDLKELSVDMFTTVFIGNSTTKNLNNKMVTPRGYKITPDLHRKTDPGKASINTDL
ncbi:precorrin-3B C(17)-methyltransferase [Anaerocolumna sp. MB42-C2]|uniref:precorrin-3B C(17)-methyltransferase n=1 Tax=Anaerocolumna sp. MB42-C2 TaxID=3070997 RepID=UPI0027E00B95|nr:precorrin-3B C(17)-methyltransferase [Anaerocolumna sp. MB42-C2]WMJ89532.1 precorrin-3B C(17)-methyltransferase [Anaerocolumna sp. MB42-C2]